MDKFVEFTQEKPAIVAGLAGLGSLMVLAKGCHLVQGLWSTFLRPSRDLYKRYSGGYAVITGASDGLGKEYAR